MMSDWLEEKAAGENCMPKAAREGMSLVTHPRTTETGRDDTRSPSFIADIP
ncbi:MAG TPA: hypothetical protein VMF50_03540 [Candidatus Binataceae bacterium]|nr:hypothetical protein [Candidatus Binataceae bacterium]